MNLNLNQVHKNLPKGQKSWFQCNFRQSVFKTKIYQLQHTWLHGKIVILNEQWEVSAPFWFLHLHLLTSGAHLPCSDADWLSLVFSYLLGMWVRGRGIIMVFEFHELSLLSIVPCARSKMTALGKMSTIICTIA